jgi:DNA gyrase subunit A
MSAGPRSWRSIDLTIEDLLADEEMVVTITRSGYIKRTHVESYRSQKRGGKGVTGMETKEEDIVEDLFVASTHAYLLFFTNKGKVHWLKVHEIPEGGRQAKGKAMVNVLSLAEGERVATCVPVRDFESGGYVFLSTKRGTVKKTELVAFSPAWRDPGDHARRGDVMAVRQTDGQREVLLATGWGWRSASTGGGAPDAGAAAGVKLSTSKVRMRLARRRWSGGRGHPGDRAGLRKQTLLDEYRLQGRSGKGIIDIKTGGRNGLGGRADQVRVATTSCS